MNSLATVLESGEPLDMVIQGGAMRGSYGIGALTALDEMGYRNRFANIWGTSAGAVNSAYFLAGQAEEGEKIYTEHLSCPRLVSKRRLRRLVDVDFLVDELISKEVALDQEAVSQSDTDLHIALMSARTGQLVWGGNRVTKWPLIETIKAALAMPIGYGKEIVIGEDVFVDGGMLQSLPLPAALDHGNKNLLVVSTRPLGYSPGHPKLMEKTLLAAMAKAKGHSSAVVRSFLRFDVHLHNAFETLRFGHSDFNIWVIAPKQKIAQRLTRSRDKILETVALGKEDARAALVS